MAHRPQIIPLLLWAFAQGLFLSACLDERQAIAQVGEVIQVVDDTVYVGNQAAALWRPITRDEFSKLLELGQGLKDDGSFYRPIPLSEVNLRSDLPNTYLRMPMEWRPQDSILLKLQDGHLTQLLYHIQQAETGGKHEA